MAEGFPQTRGVWGGFLVVWGDKKVCYACFKGARQLGFYGHALPSTIPAREFAFWVDLWQFFCSTMIIFYHVKKMDEFSRSHSGSFGIFT